MSNTEVLLQTMLPTAVALWQLEYAELTPEERKPLLEKVASTLHAKSEYLLFKKEGDTADAFNAVAKAIALLSFCPGGLDAFGHHWEYPPKPAKKPSRGSRKGTSKGKEK